MVVCDGIFDRLDSQEEVDALLGHELNHLTQGHVCETNLTVKRAAHEQVGKVRTQEIEADIRTIELLDRRGINPYGLISLLDKMSQPQPGDRPTKIHAPTHGSTQDRKITIEQALAIVDAKHLATTLKPLQKPEVGSSVTIDSAAFSLLPTAIRQSVLNEAASNVVTTSHIEAQKQIIRELSTNTAINEDSLDLQARVMLLRPGSITRNETGVPISVAQLDSSLTALNSPEVKDLASERQRDCSGNYLVEETLVTALLDDSTNAEDIAQLANSIKKHDKTYKVIDLVVHELVNKITPSNMSRIITQLATVAAHTYTTALDMSINLLDSLDQAKVQSVGTASQVEFVKELYSQFDQLRLAEAKTHTSAIQQLLYAAKMGSLSGDLREYSNWGSEAVFLDEASLASRGKAVLDSRTGPFAVSMQSNVLKTSIPRLTKELIRYYEQTGDASTVGIAANIALELQKPLEDGMDDDSDRLPHDLLPLMLLGSQGANFMGLSPRAVISSYICEVPEKASLQDWAREIVSELTAVRKAHSKLSSVNPGLINWTMDEIILSSPEIQDALLVESLKHYVESGSSAELLSLLGHAMVRRINGSNFYNTLERLAEGNQLWTAAVERLFSNTELLTGEDQLLVLAALGIAAPEVELNLNVPGKAFEMIARQRDFSGCMKLIQQEFPHLTTVHGHILSVLIEEKAQSIAEFEQLESLVEHMYDQAIDDNLGTISKANLIDTILIPLYADKDASSVRKVGLRSDEITGIQQSQLLAGLLSSGHDDSLLKKYVAERWWLEKRTVLPQGFKVDTAVNEYFNVEDYLYKRGASKQAQLLWWLQNDYPPIGSYTAFTNNMEAVYLLSAPARFLAVRKILLEGDTAVLNDSEGAVHLVDALMNSWLKADAGTETGDITRDLLINLLLANDTSTSYQHIAPMLQDMILKPPKQLSSIRSITDSIADELTERLFAAKTSQAPAESDYQAIRERTYQLFTANQAEMAEVEGRQIKRLMLGFVGAIDEEPATKKLSTIAFAALAGKKSGALGVKMLQLAGQYFDLEPEDKQEFEEVYDDMKGQTRLQAYKVLKREATTNPSTRQLLEMIEVFGPRIGGGSLFTVYKVRLNDGQDIALGIKNPNAEYRVAKLADFTSKGLSATLVDHEDDATLQLMDSLIVDAAQWVNDELKDEDFSKKDAVFKTENDTLTGNGFKKGKASYDLVMPRVLSNGSAWIRSEEFVEGKNLTGLKISDHQATSVKDGVISRGDFKQVASVIVRSYVHQVITGSYAHSDIHPGNFRVTNDNAKVVVFDRHNLIPITPKIRSTIKTAFQALVSGDTNAAAFAVAEHASGSKGVTPELSDALRKTSEQYGSDPAATMIHSLIDIKREGISVPLDLSLLLRNFMSIAQLSSQAGFGSLAEAFLHTAENSEIAQLI